MPSRCQCRPPRASARALARIRVSGGMWYDEVAHSGGCDLLQCHFSRRHAIMSSDHIPASTLRPLLGLPDASTAGAPARRGCRAPTGGAARRRIGCMQRCWPAPAPHHRTSQRAARSGPGRGSSWRVAGPGTGGPRATALAIGLSIDGPCDRPALTPWLI